MNKKQLVATAAALMAGNKGLLAMDESTDSLHRRFDKAGIPQTVEYRRAYRELIVTTPGIGDCLNGAILFDETVHQSTAKGIPFVRVLENAGIIPGIKVDEGTVELAGFPGEKITLGLDSLRRRLKDYADVGLRFAKWRAVIIIGRDMPSDGCVEANMHALARYAALCQEAGIVPIVEPEVLMDGDHGLEQCFDTTKKVIKQLFGQLDKQRVSIEGLILKPNMVIPGLLSRQQAGINQVANATVECLLESVPAAVPGVAFLSGGQSPEAATAHLNAMHLNYKTLPWVVTFSYSRAIQAPAMEYWRGKEEHVKAAQELLYRRMVLNTLARSGKYDPEMEMAKASQ
jgi:fructose-bisphosphate aldolase class I